MSTTTKSNQGRIINHKVLRQGTGFIAFCLPFVVWWLSNEAKLSSISYSYWTDSRDIFVGSLVAVAFFLAAYNGTGECRKDTEYWLSKLAGFFALIVALVPTSCCKANQLNCSCDVPAWVDTITGGNNLVIHNIAAVLLFVCLYMIINFFTRRAKAKGKDGRSNFYWFVSLLMLIGMPVLYYIGETNNWYDSLFWVELFGLVLFGIGWFVAGTYKSDPSEKPKEDEIDWISNPIQVESKEYNNATHIQVAAGEEYYFEATGCWKDASLWCGPTGWGPHWKWWTKKNRVKDQAIFTLCGNVGEDDKYGFGIGKSFTWVVPDSINELDLSERKLYLFANDWPNKYGNNSESITVTICKKK